MLVFNFSVFYKELCQICQIRSCAQGEIWEGQNDGSDSINRITQNTIVLMFRFSQNYIDGGLVFWFSFIPLKNV